MAPFDLDQRFPVLARPPIVEAMITFYGRVQNDWTPELAGPKIVAALPEYPSRLNMNQARLSFSLEATAAPPTPPNGGPSGPHAIGSTATAEAFGWAGMRVVSEDQKRVVTLMRDQLSLSWLGDYRGWSTLSEEMMRLWSIHKSLAGVDSIDRMHVRYVNRLEVSPHEFDPGTYLTGFGPVPEGMLRGPFLHQDTLGHAALMKYVVNVVRTYEQPPALDANLPLLVVLDAINPDPIPADETIIAQRLREMHWLKNYAFFSSVTKAFQELCK
jgi:uncharacterized protein (TIGR04255 family)